MPPEIAISRAARHAVPVGAFLGDREVVQVLARRQAAGGPLEQLDVEAEEAALLEQGQVRGGADLRRLDARQDLAVD